MHIFWRLVLAHFLADFTFQTDYIARWKRANMMGGLVHSSIFFLSGTILCYGNLNEVWLTLGGTLTVNGWTAMGLLSALHFLEDEWRIWTIQKLHVADSFLFFLWDQFIHLLLIFVFSPHASGSLLPEKWVILGIAFIMVTHFASIVIYFIEKDFLGRARVSPREKYFTMAERTITGLTLLIPGAPAFFVLGIWLASVIFRRWQHEHAPWLAVIAGNLIAVTLGAVARAVYYS